MLMFLVLAISILCLALLSVTAMIDAQTGTRYNPKIAAEHLVIHHAAASRYCSTNACGALVPTSAIATELSGHRQAQGAFGDGTMVSSSLTASRIDPNTGRLVHERFVLSYLSGSDSRIVDRFGGINAAMLKDELGQSGLWKATMTRSPSGSQLEIRGSAYWGEGASRTVVMIDNNLPTAGFTIPAGSPVLISRLTSDTADEGIPNPQ